MTIMHTSPTGVRSETVSKIMHILTKLQYVGSVDDLLDYETYNKSLVTCYTLEELALEIDEEDTSHEDIKNSHFFYELLTNTYVFYYKNSQS
ncbi:hypothetical protein [Listeria booriae]|uniref:Uncharacterized protein n=2 Tax=Listeria booriae TaxID=1552123 RepID=A0A7X1DLE0_9LIST|nr:hypothetical protein [Listeria booriae]MBC2312072.1 hypothetical protein [Listeria booriae]MBC6164706.1 hypothetical protein [Listeria booriae]